MKITLHTEFWFDGAHYLNNYDGKCTNLHGHTWRVEVWVRGDDTQLNEVGILFDFTEVKQLHEMFDHKLVNDVIKTNPTAEHIAMFIYKHLKSTHPNLQFKVRVYETIQPKETYVEVYEEW